MFENIFDIINVPLGYIIKFCYWLIPNYALALLLFAIIIKIVLFPLSIKQQKNMVKQASLKPKEMAIRKRYAGRTDKPTQQKMQEDLMQLYQTEKFNPMGGCLPVLIQLPVLYALYAVVTNPLKYICNMTSETITNIGTRISELYLEAAFTTEGLASSIINKLEAGTALTGIEKANIIRHAGTELFADVLPEGFSVSQLPSFKVFGGAIDLAQTPSITNINWLIAIPILTFVIVFFSMRLNRKLTYQPTETGDAAMSMKIMDFTMPLLSVWISFTVPAVIGVYWIYQNVLSTVQQFILKLMFPLPVFTEEDFKRAEKEMNGSIRRDKSDKSGSQKKVRSLHHIDDEDYEDKTGSSDKPAELSAGSNAASDKAADNTAPVSPAPLKDDSDRRRGKDNIKKEYKD